MKYPLLCCAALLIGLFIETSQADAFSTETINNSNSDGTARFVDPEEQGPFQGLAEGRTGTSAHVVKLPSVGGAEDRAQSENPVHGSTFDPWETRLLFGPFNHFGYGGSNQ